jgi:hypothetical protein
MFQSQQCEITKSTSILWNLSFSNQKITWKIIKKELNRFSGQEEEKSRKTASSPPPPMKGIGMSAVINAQALTPRRD